MCEQCDPRMRAITHVVEVQTLDQGNAKKIDAETTAYVDMAFYTDLATAKLVIAAAQSNPDTHTARARTVEISLN